MGIHASTSFVPSSLLCHHRHTLPHPHRLCPIRTMPYISATPSLADSRRNRVKA